MNDPLLFRVLVSEPNASTPVVVDPDDGPVATARMGRLGRSGGPHLDLGRQVEYFEFISEKLPGALAMGRRDDEDVDDLRPRKAGPPD